MTTAPAPITDAAGAAFVIGDGIKGGLYGEYPSTKIGDLQQGDLVPNLDFRGLYSTILEDWFGFGCQAHRQR